MDTKQSLQARRADIFDSTTFTPSASLPGTPSRISLPTTPLPALPANTPTTTTPLPSPSTFDIIAPLHEILSRLTSTSPAATNTLTYKAQQPLDIQHLVAETSSVRNRIRKARAAVEALPDVEREVAEQEVEIAELRKRIEEQRAVLVGVADM